MRLTARLTQVRELGGLASQRVASRRQAASHVKKPLDAPALFVVAADAFLVAWWASSIAFAQHEQLRFKRCDLVAEDV